MKQVISVFVAMICLTLTVACNNATNKRVENNSDSGEVSQETEPESNDDTSNVSNNDDNPESPAEKEPLKTFDMADIYYEADEDSLTFADQMYENMPKDQNYMFSPLSVKMALMMAANGAGGETQSEILEAFRIVDLDTYNEYVKNMINLYSQSDLLKLDVSNSIWLNSDNTSQKFSSQYTKKLADFYDATSDVVTNKNASDKINGWVKDKTAGKIPDIITDSNIDFTSMLVNAVYFKGRWQSEFYEGLTEKDTFVSRDGTKTEIDFMTKLDYIQCSEENGVTIVALPYLTREDIVDEDGYYQETKRIEGVDISMYLLMSDESFDPEKILSNAELSVEYVDFYMPKFNIEFSTKLNDILKTSGIEKAFGKNADFKNMFDNGNMQIGSVVHKTYIDVNEEGTEAAAVTLIEDDGCAEPPKPIEIKYNKPFTFVIKDNINGEILFMGEYAFAK